MTNALLQTATEAVRSYVRAIEQVDSHDASCGFHEVAAELGRRMSAAHVAMMESLAALPTEHIKQIITAHPIRSLRGDSPATSCEAVQQWAMRRERRAVRGGRMAA